MIRVGQRLLEERLKRGYTLDEVAKATKIRLSFLSAIEKGEYNKLPSSAYALGFVKNYIEFLSLPTKEYLPLFKREFNEKEYFKVLPEGLAKKEELQLSRIKISQPLLAVFVLFYLLLGFIVYEYRFVISNPPLDILTPSENQKIHSSALTISGRTDSNATVIVDDSPTSVDSNGVFQKKISITPGSLVIHITAQSRFGKRTSVDRHITVLP